MSAHARTSDEPSRAELENELRKLRKINTVLMDRVERNMDAQGSHAFTLFQTAITLEGRVSERTEELTSLTQRLMHEVSIRRETEKALLLAKAEAEQANLGKTHFLAAASHDLRQPLNAARLFLGALASEISGDRSRELVRRVEAALETVSDLIAAVMEISRLDTRAWTATPRSFPIATILERIADEFGPHAAAAGLSLSVVPCSAFVLTDRMLLQRALANLVSNAIRYTPAGRVLLGCRRRGPRLRIEVWDTGIGIPADDIPRIYEEFRQLGPPPRSHDKGFGLGLAIVERIVRLLALEISVRSKVGQGSCFALDVPLGDPADAPGEPESRPGPTPGNAFADLRVACIAPPGEARDALVALLESWGCRVFVAPMVPARDGHPGLIIADHDPTANDPTGHDPTGHDPTGHDPTGHDPIGHDPTGHDPTDRSGIEAVNAVRRGAQAPVPAIVVGADPALRETVEASGCGFLARPLQPAKLRAIMSHVLDQASVG